MKTSIILAIALAFGGIVATHAQTTAPAKPAIAEPKAPEGVDPKLTSTEPEYGYSQKNSARRRRSDCQKRDA